MSLMSDIRSLLKKHIKNPILVVAGSYLIWRFMNKHKRKPKAEWLSERVRIVDDADETPYSIIFDERSKKFIMIYGDRVFSAESEEDLMRMVK